MSEVGADHSPHMNTSIHLAKRPKVSIVPGETFEVRRTPIPKKEDVKEGQCLVRVEYLSVDPGMHVIVNKANLAMRGWLDDVRSYVPPVAIGEKMRGASLSTVIYSRMQDIQAGDTVISPVRLSHG